MYGFLTVALGGAIGAMLRYGAGRVAAQFTNAPGLHATFFVNIVGSALMGALVAWLIAREQTLSTHSIYLFLGIGVLGGFTTFSAFSLEVVHMLNAGESLKATAYALVSVVGAVMALFVAFHIMRRVVA